jgi:flagellar hook protein FlgE
MNPQVDVARAEEADTPHRKRPVVLAAVTAISLSGMNAAQNALDTSAHNLANQSTPGFRRQQVVLAGSASGGVDSSLKRADQPGPALVDDLVDQLAAKNSFLANLAVFKTGNAMLGALVDAKA